MKMNKYAQKRKQFLMDKENFPKTPPKKTTVKTITIKPSKKTT